MNIKNYTSELDPSVSMAKIERVLVEVGASNINKRYKDKICTGITFLIHDEGLRQTIPFHLTAQVQECFNIFWSERVQKTERQKPAVMQQANRTAWKILADWVELQCSMILLGQAKPLQMFLPFVYDVAKEETFYQKVVSGNINLLPPSQ
jgi:hypothetical protein